MKIIAGLVIGFVLGAGVMYFAYGKSAASEVHVGEVAGVVYSGPGWKMLDNQVSPEMAYHVSYPRDFDIASLDAATGSSFLDRYPVKIALPEDAFADEKTNFAGAWLAFDFDQGKSEKTCYGKVDSPLTPTDETVEINGATYHVDRPSGGAAAGNLYESTVYRLMTEDGCFEIVETLHTTNVANYDPGTVTEFDKTKVETIFDEILATVTIGQR